MGEIVPVILCGGVGSRLWPLSRKSLPKQFAQLIGDKSLFEAAIKRVDIEEFAGPIAVTSSDHRFLVEKQLRDCQRSGTILLEPVGKNTAPAILAAAYHVGWRPTWLPSNVHVYSPCVAVLFRFCVIIVSSDIATGVNSPSGDI